MAEDSIDMCPAGSESLDSQTVLRMLLLPKEIDFTSPKQAVNCVPPLPSANADQILIYQIVAKLLSSCL